MTSPSFNAKRHGPATHDVLHPKPRQDLGNSGVQERLQKDLLDLEVLSS